MSIKKYTNNAWVDIPYRKYDTEQDTITSPPTDIIADGNNATAWSIYGNIQQTGTPTPDSPIYPSECGELVNTGEHSGEYVLPIECGGVTTNVYTAEPLRKIGDYTDYKSNAAEYRAITKYEFTGQETFGTAGSGFTVNLRDAVGVAQTTKTDAICTHYQAQRYDRLHGGTVFGFAQRLGSAASNRGFAFSKGEFEDTEDFKTYLAEQYTNGSPVTVWYVLATPTTESITAPEIPTTAGSQTFDVGTELKPSKVELTYKGWHVGTVHERESGAWD